MKKSLFSILSLLLFLSGCNNIINSENVSSNLESVVSESTSNSESSNEISENLNAIELEKIIANIKEDLPKELSANFDMSIFEKYENTTITMSSSNKEVLTDNGVYTKPINDTDVTLTITVNYFEETKDFSHIVKIKGYTFDEKIEEIKAELVIENEEVISNFNLPTTDKYNATVIWESSNIDFLVINENIAEVTRPIESFEDEEITLTATISINGKTSQKAFVVKVLALKVVNIELSATPNNLMIPLNATEIDINGGVLLVTLDDQSTKEVSLKNEMITSFDSSKIGECEVNVEYYGQSTSFFAKVYKPSIEETLQLNQTKVVNFENELEPNVTIDNAVVPNSEIVSQNQAISGNSSLYIESDGNFKSLYLKDFVKFEANNSYQIKFKYKVLELTDTIYFQIASTSKFTQFGSFNTLNTVQEVTWIYTSSVDSNVIQIFPGQNAGKTKVIIDDLSVTKIPTENNVVSSLTNGGDYVLETFGDGANSIVRIDNIKAPNSKVITNGIHGCSLSFVSPGSFSGVYLVPNAGLLKAGNNYKVSFDYKISEFSDTIYFQYYNGNTPSFTQFGNANEIGQLKHFEYEIKVTNTDFVFEIFPGSATNPTSFLLDNFKIEKIAEPVVEENVYKTSLDNVGDYVLETFGDTQNAVLRVDTSPAPSSSIVQSGIEGTSLSIVSPGKHQGVYLVPNSGLLKENTAYEVSFDYKITTLADTIYFQYYNFGESTFTQFGLTSQIGQVINFKYEVIVTDPTCFFHIFPGSAASETKVLIDNVIIKKLEVYTNDIFFTQRDAYVMEEVLNVMPKTFEAKIHINQHQNTGGVILGNYSYNNNSINYEIESGKVKVVFKTKDETTTEFTFNSVDVRSSNFVHLAVVKDSTKLHCYLDGVLKQSLDCMVNDFVCDSPFTIGGDNSANNSLYFKGRIHSITLYEDVRTANEILNDISQVDLNDDKLLVHYNLKDKVGATKIEDENENIDVKLLGLWLDQAPEQPDYSYSFAVVGDTQILTCFYPEQLHNIYDYISENVESQNIKHVFGLGDITDKNTVQEWQLAVQEITKLDGKVPYSLIRGNHDGYDNFNKYFGSNTTYSNQYSEMYNNNTNNTIHYFSAGNLDYMVVALDIGASDDIINWVSSNIETHPNHNVIITTHAHLNSDGNYLDSANLLAPSNLGGVNNGADLEEKLIKKYENIVLVMCGHISVDGVVKTTLTGNNGNMVTQLLIDPQGIDYEIGPTGLVAMLYFSEDGSDVTLQYYSTIHKKYKRNGQVSFELNTIQRN